MNHIARMNANLATAIGDFALIAHGECTRSGSMLLCYSGRPLGLFNAALLRFPTTDFEGAANEAAAWFASRSESWSFWLCEDLLSPQERRRARVVLASLGMKPMMTAPGMVATSLLEPCRELPHIEAIRVTRPQDRYYFSEIMYSAFHLPLDDASAIYASEGIWSGHTTGWIAFANGEPVSTAATVCSDELIGFFNVGTAPPHERKGYAEALMRHAAAIAQAESGYTRHALQSSPAGFPLYARMGFRQLTTYAVYLR